MKTPVPHTAAMAVLLLLIFPVSMALGQTVSLTYEGGLSPQWLTPGKFAERPARITIRGLSGTVPLFGQEIPIAAQTSGQQMAVGLDCNGDGQMDKGEYRQVAPGGTASFDLELGKGKDRKKFAVHLTEVLVLSSPAGSIIQAVPRPAHAWKATVNGVTVHLVDDNFDGRITLDGQDAIVMGNGPAALPLKTHHQIGDKHFQLKISDDGAKLEAKPAEKPELGAVETPFNASGLGCLIVASDSGAYDLKASGAKGIPAGEYRLVYGVVTAGDKYGVLTPTKNTPAYAIAAGVVNRLRIGNPLRLEFRGKAAFDGNGATVTITPDVKLVGSGNEVYDLAAAGGMGKPKVVIGEGDRIVSVESMAFG